MSSIWSFLTSWTNSVDEFRKNNTIGGWGGPATVWNPKKGKEFPEVKKPKPESNPIENYRNNLKVGGWGGPATVWNPKMAAKAKREPKVTECDTDIADLTGKPQTNSYHKKSNNEETDEMIADLVVANSMH